MKVINRRFGDTKSLKIYRSDNGGEFLGAEFRKVCEDEGISTEMSEPDAHHQNGVAERTHRTLADSARALMLQDDMPHYLCEYAIRSAVHTRNRVLAKCDKTNPPFEKNWGRKPDMKHVKTFGQRCVVLIPSEERSTKFQFRLKGRAGIFLGSDPEQKGYFVYVTGRGHRVVHSRSVVFLEPPNAHTSRGDHTDDPLAIVDEAEESSSDNDSNGNHEERVDDEPETKTTRRDGLRESSRRHRNRQPEISESPEPLRRSIRIVAQITGQALSAEGATLDAIIQAPQNLREAKNSKDWPRLEKAIQEEIQALRDNDTFEVVGPPSAPTSSAVWWLSAGNWAGMDESIA